MSTIDDLLQEYQKVQALANEYLDQMAALKEQIGALMVEKKYSVTVGDTTTFVSKQPASSKLNIAKLLSDPAVIAAKATISDFSTTRLSVTKFREWAEGFGWPGDVQEEFVDRTGKEIIRISTDTVHEPDTV